MMTSSLLRVVVPPSQWPALRVSGVGPMIQKGSILSLYRKAMRISRNFPLSMQLRKKLGDNVRIMFTIRKHETDAGMIQQLYEQGVHDVRVLETLASQPEDVLRLIFRKNEMFINDGDDDDDGS